MWRGLKDTSRPEGNSCVPPGIFMLRAGEETAVI